MQHDWFMYHLRSTYKNRLDFPFKQFETKIKQIWDTVETFCPGGSLWY